MEYPAEEILPVETDKVEESTKDPTPSSPNVGHDVEPPAESPNVEHDVESPAESSTVEPVEHTVEAPTQSPAVEPDKERDTEEGSARAINVEADITPTDKVPLKRMPIVETIDDDDVAPHLRKTREPGEPNPDQSPLEFILKSMENPQSD